MQVTLRVQIHGRRMVAIVASLLRRYSVSVGAGSRA